MKYGIWHGIWRAVDQDGVVLDVVVQGVLVQGRRDEAGAKRLVRKRLGRAGRRA